MLKKSGFEFPVRNRVPSEENRSVDWEDRKKERIEDFRPLVATSVFGLSEESWLRHLAKMLHESIESFLGEVPRGMAENRGERKNDQDGKTALLDDQTN